MNAFSPLCRQIGLITVLMITFVISSIAKAQTMQTDHLDAHQRAIVPIAAYTANGNLEALNKALNDGLEAGLSVNEIKEILIQMYAYCGFPRSLNGIATFMTVMEVRTGKGIEDKIGRDPSPQPADMTRDELGMEVRNRLAGRDVEPPPSGYQLFTPTIDVFLKEHLFADIIARDNLDIASRELATISALAAMEGTEAQLRFHMGATMNVGITPSQMLDFIAVLETTLGKQRAESARSVLETVLDSRTR